MDEQQDEIIALKAIFSEEEYLKLSGEENPDLLTSGDFSANVQLSDPFKLQGITCSRYVDLYVDGFHDSSLIQFGK